MIEIIRSPIVDVVVPVFNPNGFLDEAVNSVLAQTFTNWRLSLIDDGSTIDFTDFRKIDSRIRMVRQDNRGQAAARNLGIDLADAPYIAFLDQDDVWMPTMLEHQIATLETDETAMFSHTQFLLIDRHGVSRGKGFGRRQTYHEMLNGSGVCGASTVIAKRESLIAAGLFDSLLEPAEDYDLWLRLSLKYSGCFVESVEVAYRLHEGNQTRRYGQTHHAVNSILQKHRNAAIGRFDLKSAKAALIGIRRIRGTYASQAYDAARQSWKTGEIVSTWRHLWYVMVNSPRVLIKGFSKYICSRIFAKHLHRGIRIERSR